MIADHLGRSLAVVLDCNMAWFVSMIGCLHARHLSQPRLDDLVLALQNAHLDGGGEGRVCEMFEALARQPRVM